MGKEKDLSEKILEEYNDVFADIVNGIVFKGKPIIQPEELQNTMLEAMYRSVGNGKIRSQERDVAKIWKKNGIKIALCGLENQTMVDKYMPLRIMGYEGISYRDMLKNGSADVYPVMTLVLYFGDEHWQSPKSVKGIFADKPYWEEMDGYLNDVKANICEVAFLTIFPHTSLDPTEVARGSCGLRRMRSSDFRISRNHPNFSFQSGTFLCLPSTGNGVHTFVCARRFSVPRYMISPFPGKQNRWWLQNKTATRAAFPPGDTAERTDCILEPHEPLWKAVFSETVPQGIRYRSAAGRQAYGCGRGLSRQTAVPLHIPRKGVLPLPS